MILADKKETIATEDRTTLEKVAAVGATPGQRLLGWVAAIVACVLIIGGVGYRFVYSPITKGEQALEKPKATPATTPATEPSLNVPLDLGGDSAPANQAGQAGGVHGQAQGDKPFPPGLIGSPNQQAGQQPGQQVYGTDPAPATYDGGGNATGPTPAQQAMEEARKRKMTGSLGSFSSDSSEAQAAAEVAVQPVPLAPRAAQAGIGMDGSGTQPGPAAKTSISAQLVGTPTPKAVAGYITNQHLTLRRGTPISCNLGSEIKTDQVGFLDCVLDFPVKSMDGTVVLMEAGTTIFGEYQRGVDRGGKAIFVLWTEAITPLGVTVPLDSPGTGQLGSAGLEGEVDNKFWQRFSGAFMFSILQDGAAYATQKAVKPDTTGDVVVMPNTQTTGTSAASEILKQGADIKSTLYKRHGSAVGITVARHVDFSSVYKLSLQEPKR